MINTDEQLIELYSTIGQEKDHEGNIISKGCNWLEDLNETEKVELARLYNSLAWTLSNTESLSNIIDIEDILDIKGIDDIRVLVFPMVRRAYLKLQHTFDVMEFLTIIQENYNTVWDIEFTEEQLKTTHIDEVAMKVVLLTDIVVEQLQKKTKD